MAIINKLSSILTQNFKFKLSTKKTFKINKNGFNWIVFNKLSVFTFAMN